MLEHQSKTSSFQKIYVGELFILNTGKIDYSEFKFGVTFDENIQILDLGIHSTDRHHEAKLEQHPTFDLP